MEPGIRESILPVDAPNIQLQNDMGTGTYDMAPAGGPSTNGQPTNGSVVGATPDLTNGGISAGELPSTMAVMV